MGQDDIMSSVGLIRSSRVTARILLTIVTPLPRIDIILGRPSVRHADGGVKSGTHCVLVHKVRSGGRCTFLMDKKSALFASVMAI